MACASHPFPRVTLTAVAVTKPQRRLRNRERDGTVDSQDRHLGPHPLAARSSPEDRDHADAHYTPAHSHSTPAYVGESVRLDAGCNSAGSFFIPDIGGTRFLSPDLGVRSSVPLYFIESSE